MYCNMKISLDIVFFDESIDAKMNRNYFTLNLIDTPFLASTVDNHLKTYVPPAPDTAGLVEGCLYSYQRFPTLKYTAS